MAIARWNFYRSGISYFKFADDDYHYRYSVRIAIVQDGQACAPAIRSGNRRPVDSKYYKAAKATLDEAVTDVNNWIDQQAAKAE